MGRGPGATWTVTRQAAPLAAASGSLLGVSRARSKANEFAPARRGPRTERGVEWPRLSRQARPTYGRWPALRGGRSAGTGPGRQRPYRRPSWPLRRGGEAGLALRREDFRAPVVTAYLAALRDADPGAKARTVRDLAGSLALKLDRGVQSVSEALRPAFRQVTEENLDEVTDDAVTAHIDEAAHAGHSEPGRG